MQFVLRYIFPFKIPRFIAETTAELYFWCRKKRRGSVAAEPRLAGLFSPWGKGVCAKHTEKVRRTLYIIGSKCAAENTRAHWFTMT